MVIVFGMLGSVLRSMSPVSYLNENLYWIKGTRRQEEAKVHVTEMRMLRWTCGIGRKNRFRMSVCKRRRLGSSIRR